MVEKTLSCDYTSPQLRMHIRMPRLPNEPQSGVDFGNSIMEGDYSRIQISVLWEDRAVGKGVDPIEVLVSS